MIFKGVLLILLYIFLGGFSAALYDTAIYGTAGPDVVMFGLFWPIALPTWVSFKFFTWFFSLIL